MYRLSLTRITAVIITITICVVIWNVFSVDNDDRSEIVNGCNMTIKYLSDLEKLLEKYNEYLQMLVADTNNEFIFPFLEFIKSSNLTTLNTFFVITHYGDRYEHLSYFPGLKRRNFAYLNLN